MHDTFLTIKFTVMLLLLEINLEAPNVITKDTESSSYDKGYKKTPS